MPLPLAVKRSFCHTACVFQTLSLDKAEINPKPAQNMIEMLEQRIAPAVFTVTTLADTNDGSLRAALDAADNHPGHDTIQFHLHAPPAHSENIILLADVIVSTGNVTIQGPGAGKLAVSGGGAHSVFYFSDASDKTDSPVTITGLSVINGKGSYSGGIYAHESLTLRNDVITGNISQDDGGIVVNGALSKVNISSCLISGNVVNPTTPPGNSGANFSGGGVSVFVGKSVSIAHSVITENYALNGLGGGVYAGLYGTGGSISITNSLVTGNSAPAGAGLYLSNGSTALGAKTIVNAVKIINNRAAGNGSSSGGGMIVDGDPSLITGSTIRGNTAGSDGGGIKVFDTTLTILNTRVTGNTVTSPSDYGLGGGLEIYQDPANATLHPVNILNTSITGNDTTKEGGGIFAYGSISLNIVRSSLAGNQAPKGAGLDLSATPGAALYPVKVTNSQFTDNHATNEGGGILATGGISLNITSSTFAGNHATRGGGINVFGTDTSKVDLTLNNTTLTENSATLTGGGLQTDGTGALNFIGGTVSENSAHDGGGLQIMNMAPVALKNVAVLNNFVTKRGGGVQFFGATAFAVSGGRFAGNSATTGGAISVWNGSAGSIGASITGNTAFSTGGGIDIETGSTLFVQIAKVITNSAGTDPDVSGFFTPMP